MDPVRAYLAEAEYGHHVVDGGLDYLRTEWDRVASEAENGATWVSEEWVNDLDARQIIHELLENVPEAAVIRSQVEITDRRFRAAVRMTDECAWGEANAERHGWTRDENWWYWTEPRTPYE